MVSQAIKQLAPLLAELGSFATGQGVAHYAAPAVAAKSSGLFGGKRVDVPLSEPLPGVDIPKYTAPAPPKLETGAIEGVKAAALDTGGPNVAVALFVGAGSASETPATAGASKVLEYLAFSATSNRSTFRLTRELEKYGAAAAALAGRESIAYGVEGTKLQASEVTEILLDAVLNMRLNYWEINDILPQVQADMERAYSQPTVLATELLHRAAFSGGLSQPLLPDPDTLSSLTPEAIHEFVATHFTASNMTLASAGYSLTALTGAAAPLLAAGARKGAGGAAAPGASKYTGGVLSALAPGAVPVVALAYQAPGGLSDLKSTALAAVIKALLNDTREVVPYQDKQPEAALSSVMPVVHVYKSTGLIGLLATPSNGAGAAVDALSARFEALAKGVPEAALTTAKQVSLGGYQSAVSTKSGAVQEVAQQLLARGSIAAGEYAAAVSAITAADVSGAVAAMIKGAPTLVATGPLSDLPKYDTVAKRFS